MNTSLHLVVMLAANYCQAMKPAADNYEERSSAQPAVTTEHMPSNNMDSSQTYSRVRRLMTVQELLLEYSLVIVLLGCFFLVVLPIKGLRSLSACENDISWM